jgi:NitT/TauT family transport system ATP-binding protein
MDQVPLCETKGIGKVFIMPDNQVLRVLEKIDIQIYPDEILAIIGPSGCGKSTFLRILAGLIPPTEGKVFYHGKHVAGLLPDFSYVFQNFALFPWMTVTQNIEMVLKTMDLSEEEIKKRTAEAISMIGLTGFEEVYPREISGGMKQRVGLARALVRKPELLLLDEPFSSLDTFTAEVLSQELLDIWENKENELSSILLISHDVREVAFLADRIIMMEANPGRVRFVKENRLPRPRDYHSQGFLNLVDTLHDAYSQEEKPSPVEPVTPLFPVTAEEVLGFLFYLSRHGDPKALYQIGTGSIDHFSHILLRANAAKLLKFVAIENRNVALTEAGKKYLFATPQNRRTIWKEQLLTIPLFRQSIKWLRSGAKHSLSHKELTDLIAKELPRQNPHEQCKILIGWGSYGNLFAYHRSSRIVMLKNNAFG